ncbi:MAG: hypothetical protein KJ645_01490, partial [Planctomycetes bacterium]|nr:hypothetical protein [Planctomycetota bacterium]
AGKGVRHDIEGWSTQLDQQKSRTIRAVNASNVGPLKCLQIHDIVGIKSEEFSMPLFSVRLNDRLINIDFFLSSLFYLDKLFTSFISLSNQKAQTLKNRNRT